VDAGFLERLLGGDRTWSSPCTVIVAAEAAVRTPGPDSIVAGGQKSYAPRVSTGRLTADAVMLLKDEKVVLTVEQVRLKDNTGQTHVKRTLTVVDVSYVVGVEFEHVQALKVLGVGDPPAVRDNEYRPGMLVG
jgi:hypothetical protein